MRLINEIRTKRFGGPGGDSIEARERVLGIDALAGSRGVLFERHTPVDLQVTTSGDETTHAFSNHGATARLAPYAAAPVVAMLITKLARAKGRKRHGLN